MLLKFYKAMMGASTPLLEAYLKKRQGRGKEDPARASERRGQAGRPKSGKPLVWFHAASVGESLSLLSIISRLLADHPHIEVMVTTGTVTSAKLMAERLPPGAFHQYMPVDHPAWVEKFLDHWQPGFVAWAESEFWPNMLSAIARRRIPAVLLNARMSETSFRRWKWAKGAISEILSGFSTCLAQNQSEASRLNALGAKDVRVSANLKYAAAPLPFVDSELKKLREQVAGKKLLLWASTHPGEEEIALATHGALKKKFSNLLTIIVPRHPQRGADVLALAQKAGIEASLRSRGEGVREVYIADTMGELGLFFRLSQTVVMGGTFADIGGHNPIEPAQLGCTVFYGPVMYNFATINDDFLYSRAAVQVRDVEELGKKLEQAFATPEKFASVARAALLMTGEKAHIVDDLAELLSPYITQLGQGGQAP